MRILIDLDGTIAELKKNGQEYGNIRINPRAAEKIKALKAAGHYIIIQTARHMKTCGGDQGQVMAKIGKQTLEWLDRQGIPYDEIYFGKPYADIYIDDLAWPFLNWDAMDVDGLDTELVNILIPMAGAGSRFVKAGFDRPKPFIEALGKPMVAWAAQSFNFLDRIKKYRFIFVVLREHLERYDAEMQLKKMFGPDTVVVIQDGLVDGQSRSCLLAKSYIDNLNRLIIYNCDTYATSEMWSLVEQEDPDGIIPCFNSQDARYSYAKNDEFGYVSEVAEKRVVSNLATVGMYYFKRGADYVRAAEKQITKNEAHNGEFYVGPCYNELIAAGKRIRTVPTDAYWVLGTPEELRNFESNYL